MSTVNEVKKKHIAKQCGTVTFCLKKNFNWYLYGKASGNIMYAKVLMEVVKLFLNRWNCAGFFFSVYLYYLIFRNAHVFFITKKVILIIKTHTETRLGIIFAAKKKHIGDSKGRESTYNLI